MVTERWFDVPRPEKTDELGLVVQLCLLLAATEINNWLNAESVQQQQHNNIISAFFISPRF